MQGALILLAAVGSASAAVLTCEEESSGEIHCDNGISYSSEALVTPGSGEFWLYLLLCLFLICMAGIMSGLTLGLLSLDMTTLTVMMNSGDEKTRGYAKRILPLIERHHLLLVTLLLGNALCMEALPLFLDKIVPFMAAIILSVTGVLIFGEILPQAVCSRYGLAIGAKLYYVVWFFICLFFIVAYPLSKALDYLFGHDHGTFFRRNELKALVELHGKATNSLGNAETLTADEVVIIKGALSMTNRKLSDAMTPLERVFMLNGEDLLSQHVIGMIQERGHSRIPVYDGSVHNIIGILTIKYLLGLDANSNMSLGSAPMRDVLFMDEHDGLYETLNIFQTGRSHMAVVLKHGDPRTVVGIITLEDVLEELIQEEINNETALPMDVRMRFSKLRLRPVKDRGERSPEKVTSGISTGGIGGNSTSNRTNSTSNSTNTNTNTNMNMNMNSVVGNVQAFLKGPATAIKRKFSSQRQFEMANVEDEEAALQWEDHDDDDDDDEGHGPLIIDN